MKREDVLTIDEAIKFVDRCHYGTRCPYLNGGDIRCLIGERDYLSQRLDEMESLIGVAEAKIEKLRRENEELKEEKEALHYDLKQMLGKIFKPQVKPHHDADQPKRGAPCGHHGNSRRRPEEISEFIDIYPDKCRIRLFRVLDHSPPVGFIQLPPATPLESPPLPAFPLQLSSRSVRRLSDPSQA